ncbi:hypothetical protein GTR02_19080 [Kineococcus sp. R8]|uniref:hypothetical protein n=1 Tax=Kineococcus siccus TaxID=2696567 RepID=UPI001412EDD3|nr:hypothetical protein [Kineococcus siccus]NAZ83919.1 hypothetical protein [Kineococcus siccus]
MTFAGGNPDQLQETATALDTLSQDLTGDALALTGQGRSAGACAGDATVAGLAETALAAVGGAVLATATVVAGLSQGATTAGGQLETATGGSGPR